jgi:hypothetical protein
VFWSEGLNAADSVAEVSGVVEIPETRIRPARIVSARRIFFFRKITSVTFELRTDQPRERSYWQEQQHNPASY